MRINASGCVGIGTTSPSTKLDVRGNIYANDGSSTAISVYNAGSIRGKMSMTGNEGDLTLYGSSANALVYLSAYYNSYFNGGNVGIGTTSPAYKLDVVGNAYISGLITQGAGIYKVTGTLVLGGSATGTLYTFSNSATNQVYFVTVRQQGSGTNNLAGICFGYSTGFTAYNLAQDNTNAVLLLTLGTSGTDIRLTTGSGYGTTTWEYTITQIK